jgi:hypothetical protein
LGLVLGTVLNLGLGSGRMPLPLLLRDLRLARFHSLKMPSRSLDLGLHPMPDLGLHPMLHPMLQPLLRLPGLRILSRSISRWDTCTARHS